jgi:formylglycine-generating enzyme required for sulfatase activity
MNNTGRPVDRPARKPTSPASLFKKLLQAFEDGDLPYADVQSDLQRLLANGASAEELRGVLRQCESISPLPEYAQAGVLRILNSPVERPADIAGVADLADAGEPVAAVAGSRVRPETAAAIEERVARDRADYQSLTHAYERARDAGSTAAARITELAAELGGLRDALDAERSRASQLEQALNEARTARAAAIDAVHVAVSERDQRLAALQKEHAARVSDAGAGSARLDAELQAERARSAALDVDLAEARHALEAEQRKTRETHAAFVESVAHGERLLQDADRHDAELRALRDMLDARTAAAARVEAEFRAELEALRAHSAPLETQMAAVRAHCAALETQLAAARAAVDSEQRKVRDLDAALAVVRVPSPAAAGADVTAAADPHRAALVRADSQLTIPMGPPRAEPAAVMPGHSRPVSPPGGRPGGVSRMALIGAAVVIAVIFGLFVRHHGSMPAQVAAVITPPELPAPGSVIRDCPTCPAVTVLPTGTFKQGSSRADGAAAAFEKPLHSVTIAHPFALSTNAVTVDEFRAFITATGRDMRGCDIYDDRWHVRPDGSWENPGFVQSGSHPVTCVSWNDAKAYAAWLSTSTGHHYRLPSASEWEYAARAGGEALQPWNPDGTGACAAANVADQSAARRYPGWSVFGCDDGYVYTAPVGTFKANAFGLHDMLGNVFQWTDDCWHPDYTDAPVDGSARAYGDCSERELRGGSWYTSPEFVRASYRNHFASGYRASSIGLRLVREMSP